MKPELRLRVDDVMPPTYRCVRLRPGWVTVLNEVGRELFTCCDEAFTLTDWRKFVGHLQDLASARAWIDSLARSQKTRPS